ncbi:MAG: TonB family protein [Aquificaceae bacterium]|nr:TonB family protein [Aquificaceae bacterium]MDW8433533.1 TonB family protein [Aquificaceae bacterium]
MIEGKRVENLLHLSISLVINLLLFTLLSLYLLVKVEMVALSTLEVEVRTMPQVEEVKFTLKGKTVSTTGGEGRKTSGNGTERLETAPMELNRDAGDVPVPAGPTKEEPSILKDIEQRLKGKSKDVEREGVRSADMGDMSAVVSSEGLRQISGGLRSAVYIPPFPRIVSEEPLSVFKVRIWVEPSGVVSKVQIVQRSGSPQVDQRMVEFVRNIKFEPIKENIVQTGVITFRFKGG